MQETYRAKAIPALQKKFGYKSIMAAPLIKKVVLNSSFGQMASGKSNEDARQMGESIAMDMSLIAVQKPVLTLARKSIATFKLRPCALVRV